MDGNLSTGGSQIDLEDAFAALAELARASSPLDAAWVAAAAIDALVSTERLAIYLYDHDAHLLRRVAGKPDAHEVTLDVATSVVGRAISASADDARTLGSPDDDGLLLVRGVCADGRLRGGIVLSRAASGPVFGVAELRVTDYVADRFAERLAR